MGLASLFLLALLPASTFALPQPVPAPQSLAPRFDAIAETDTLLFDTHMDQWRTHMRHQTPEELDWDIPGCDHLQDYPFMFKHACQRWQWGIIQYQNQGRMDYEARKKLDDLYAADCHRQCVYVVIPRSSCDGPSLTWSAYFRDADLNHLLGPERSGEATNEAEAEEEE